MKCMKEICSIYVIRNSVNDKVYIGQTWNNVKSRFYKHKRLNNTDCPKLFNAMNKYGRENFYVEQILCIKNQKDADYFEDYFIKEFDTIKNGYNIKSGGSNGKHSEETILILKKYASMRKGKPGKKHTEISKQKISEGVRGKNHPNFGKTGPDTTFYGRIHSEETKQKMREAQAKLPSKKGIPISDKTKNLISIGNTGKVRTLIQKQNQSIRVTGKNNNFYGKKHTEESLKKMAIASTGRKQSPETLAKRVLATKITKANKKLAKEMQQFYASTIYLNLDI